MTEQKIKHQHFIPRSYLRYFAQNKKEKKFVDAYNIQTGQKINASTKSVCVKANLYTLPAEKDGDPYLLEKFYAREIDSVYPEVYKLLIDKSVKSISNRQKHKIIYTLMSLYFRTPKFLNLLNKVTDDIIDRSLKMTDRARDIIKIDMDGRKIEFARSEADKIKEQLASENRMVYLKTQFEMWHEFVSYKYKCGISVFEIDDDTDLITSDNPVSIHSSAGNRFNLFDPTNIIQVPIDRKHYLVVFPNTEHASENELFRGKRDKIFALSSNLSTEKNTEMWIIGFPGTLDKHLFDQKKYGEINEDNMAMVEKIKETASLMNELLKTAETYGFFSYQVADKVRAYRKMEALKGNHDLQHYVEELAKQGFLTV
jgi:hypothetical protein